MGVDETRARFRCPFFRDELDGSNKVIFGSSVRLDDPDFERHPRCAQQIQCTKGGVLQKWRGTARRLGADDASNKMAKTNKYCVVVRLYRSGPRRPSRSSGLPLAPTLGSPEDPGFRRQSRVLVNHVLLARHHTLTRSVAGALVLGLRGSVRARSVKNEPLGAGNPSHDRDGLICGFLSLHIGLVRERALMSGWPDTSTPPLPRPLM